MKKKSIRYRTIIIAIVGVVGFLLISNIYAKKEQQKAFEQWSVIVANNFKKMQEEADVEIYAKGKNVTIPKLEYEQMVEYYKLSKLSDEEAKKEADTYVKERYALYAKAIESGYTVTKKEINAYMKELKEDMEKEENKDTVETIKSAFGSEELYWEYERELSKIDLPIQKYINAIAKEYEESHEKVTEKEWNTEFESIKNELVEAEDFQVSVK